MDAVYALATIIVLAVCVVILAIIRPEVALALLGLIQRVLEAFLRATNAAIQNVKRK